MNKTLKKSLSIILATLLCFSCFAVTGFAATQGALTFEVTDGSAVLTACDVNASGAIVVPSVVEIKGKSYNVKAIGDSAFAGCTKITSVSIAEGITSIGSKAFANCTALTDVYVPQTLSICQYTAFSGCGTVTVHCYSSNYQFFTVYGLSENVKIDILDSEEESGSAGTSSGLTNTIVELIKRILVAILSLFMGKSTQTATA
ncbi:MAG: leucine-rich repeat protein [Clostridia bacterium]|nr:leucine-rich repeat protein [Clostridia bacterium]